MSSKVSTCHLSGGSTGWLHQHSLITHILTYFYEKRPLQLTKSKDNLNRNHSLSEYIFQFLNSGTFYKYCLQQHVSHLLKDLSLNCITYTFLNEITVDIICHPANILSDRYSSSVQPTNQSLQSRCTEHAIYCTSNTFGLWRPNVTRPMRFTA